MVNKIISIKPAIKLQIWICNKLHHFIGNIFKNFGFKKSDVVEKSLRPSRNLIYFWLDFLSLRVRPMRIMVNDHYCDILPFVSIRSVSVYNEAM